MKPSNSIKIAMLSLFIFSICLGCASSSVHLFEAETEILSLNKEMIIPPPPHPAIESGDSKKLPPPPLAAMQGPSLPPPGTF